MSEYWDERETMTQDEWEETRAGLHLHLKETEDRFWAFEQRKFRAGIQMFCPITPPKPSKE